MARERTPQITIDSLQPTGTRRGFWATWTENTLCAYAELRPLEDDPGNGYVLECWYERTTTRGAMGQRQEEQGRKLIAQVRAYMQAALLEAGWHIVAAGKDTTTPDIWKHQSQNTPALIQQEASLEHQESRIQKIIEVYGSKEAREHGHSVAYRRVISVRPITIVCTLCGQEDTQERYPGPLPRYCRTCAEEAARERTRLRVQQYRQRKQEHPPTATATAAE